MIGHFYLVISPPLPRHRAKNPGCALLNTEVLKSLNILWILMLAAEHIVSGRSEESCVTGLLFLARLFKANS